MTAINVEGQNALDAWRSGAILISQQQGELFHLFTTIHNPTILDDEWLTEYSPKTVSAANEDIRDVVSTIFPTRILDRSENRDDFYARYLKVADRGSRWRRNRSAWGTYFERLVRFPESNVNQLERAIEKLNSWPRNKTGLVFHLSSPSIDTPRTRGGPCWHFGELLWQPNNQLDLAVVYRNHDYLNKALGNFLALGQLLKFICDATNKTPGKIISHSMHAYTEQIGQLRSLAKTND